MGARVGRERDRREDAHGELFAPERPNEKQEGECDVGKRPERDQARGDHVAVRFEERERLGKVRGRPSDNETTGATRTMRAISGSIIGQAAS